MGAAVVLVVLVCALALLRPAEAGGEAAPRAEGYVSGYEIVRTMPHDPNAFTQGLAFASDGTLYESDPLVLSRLR